MKKIDFAVQWLHDHPRDMFATGRDLECRVRMSEFRTISYKVWNEAKKLINTPVFNDVEISEPRHTIIVNFKEGKYISFGKKSRTTHTRDRKRLTRVFNLCVSDGYKVFKPEPDVYMFTKEAA